MFDGERKSAQTPWTSRPIGNGKLKTEGTVHAVCGQTEEPSLHLDMSPRKTEANGCEACDDASGEHEIVNGEPVDE